MKKYYFEIQFMDHNETHWTKDTTVDNARDTMWDRYGSKAITITFVKEEYPKNIKEETEMKKLTGLKKAVGDYKRYNAGGYYDPEYGVLMYDTETGELWTDQFYSIGHGSYKHYADPSIVCISGNMKEQGIEVNMKNVKEFIEKNFKED